MRIIVDTSTLLAYLLSRGKNSTSEIFNLVKVRKISLVTCKEVLAEFKMVLSKDKIKRLSGYRSHIVSGFVAWYQYNCRFYSISGKKDSGLRDEKDSMFIELAKVSKADFIISGDKDLLSIKSVGKTRIVKPDEFMKSI